MRLGASSLVWFDLTLGRLAGRSPVVIARRSTLRVRERNGFELGRDSERGQRRAAVEALAARLSQCEEKVADLKV